MLSQQRTAEFLVTGILKTAEVVELADTPS
jgi:hypothetical protein